MLTTVDILDVHAGLGRHRYSLDVHQVKKILKWALIMYILEYITICLVKISISLMILRYKKERWLKYSLYGLMAGLVVTNGACIIGLFVCPDPKKFNYLAYVQSGDQARPCRCFNAGLTRCKHTRSCPTLFVPFSQSWSYGIYKSPSASKWLCVG